MKKTINEPDFIQKFRQDLTVSDTLCGQPLTFTTTWGLFSPKAIDEGSRLLLDHISVNPDDDCLDVGCGYGVLGMTLAKLAPEGHSVMVDKDFVAVEYTNKNIQDNAIPNAEAFLSNAFNQVGDRQFDLIVSNLPAKVGNELLTLYSYDALQHLKPGGRYCVVTINGLRQFIKRSFNDIFGNYKKLKQGKNYTVAMAVKE